ncbi:MAG: type II toxin-antitoxin system RelE/ParE family toxin [Planctomycetota bacterium]
MAYKVNISEIAGHELFDLSRELVRQSRSRELGDRFLLAAFDTLDRTAKDPLARPLSYHRPPGRDTLRHVLVDGFPNHVIFYIVEGEEVQVVRAFHAAMDLPRRLSE